MVFFFNRANNKSLNFALILTTLQISYSQFKTNKENKIIMHTKYITIALKAITAESVSCLGKCLQFAVFYRSNTV